MPRRTFLTTAAAGVAGAALGNAPSSPLSAFAERACPERSEGGPGGEDLWRWQQGDGPAVNLGVASYSLRRFPRDQAIAMVKALGVAYINLKSVHLPYDAFPEELAAARREIEAAGLRIVGGGTITFERDTDADVEKYFAYARGAGMPLIVATADPGTLPRIERFARRYDIKVAIHNHGPEDKHYPSPYDALKHVRDMDPRMGLCIDIGHTVRTGTDVVRAVRDAGPRLLDMHVKDLRDLKAKESQCIVGEGKIPIPDILRQLLTMGYRGYANLEYEIDPDDPLPGMKQSFAYLRGVLAGLAAAHHASEASQ